MSAVWWVARWIGWPEMSPRSSPRAIDGYLALSRLPGFGGSLEPRSALLARYLAAQLSGCRWCIDRAGHDWRCRGFPSEVLCALDCYSSSSLFTARERAALAFVEAVAGSKAPADALRVAQAHLSDIELAELTAIAADHHCLDNAAQTLQSRETS
jgi:alkylhydroperoxidase family enzyme